MSSPLPPLFGVLPDGPVVMLCVDGRYALDHVPAFARSLAANDPGRALHVHVVNLTEGIEAILALVAADTGLTLTISYELADLTVMGAQDRKAYYACIRFVRAAQVLRLVDAPLWVLDADSIVLKPLPEPSEDYAIFERPDHPDHMRVAAGAVFLRPTLAGHAFLDGTAGAISKAIEQGGLQWYLDQLCLAGVHEMVGREVEGRSYLRLTNAFMGWEPEHDCVVYTGKGPRKDEQGRYLDLAKAYAFTPSGLRERFWGRAAA